MLMKYIKIAIIIIPGLNGRNYEWFKEDKYQQLDNYNISYF